MVLIDQIPTGGPMAADKPILDPKTQWFLNFLESSGRPQVHQVPVAEARELYVRGQAIAPVVRKPAQIEDRTIPHGEGSLKLRVFRPEDKRHEGSSGRLPV